MESVSCAKRLLVVFISLMAFASIATTSSLRDKGTELRAIPENFRVVRSVTGRSWDFSGCAPECRLKLGGKILNKRNLVLTTLDAIKLAPLMHNETLEDRMYVWGEIASMASQREQGNSTNEYNVEELDKFEGDIIIGRETVDEMMRAYTLDNTTDNNNNARSKRRAITFDNFLWTGEIPWKFHSNAFTSAQQSRIKQAVKHWQDNTCVRFKQHPDRQTLTGPHIKFVKKSGCWSYIGKQKTGQDLSIGSTCFRLGVMSHEIGHALGLYHEQSRPDRDLYISINYGNIRGNPSINFAAKNWRFVRTLGIPYDYSSAMHYGAFDFSKNRKPTISPKDPRMQQVLGQRESLSFLDIKIVNVLYCSDKCGGESLEWSRCKNGGYRDPNNCNQCKCPRGFAPPTCGGIARGVNANCGRQYLQAGAEEKSLVSPGYPNGYPDDADCAWLIRAPSHHRIKLQFQGTFVVQATRPTCLAYVEVRYKDVTRVGARYCWYTAPKDILFSHGVEALILLHTKTKGYRGFNLTYVAEKCGGCSRNAGGIEPVCFKSEKYDCSVEVNAICDRRLCKKKRKNTCIRESSYCCPGYQKSGDFCIRTTQRNPISGRTPTPRRPVIVPTTTTTTSTTTSTTTTTTTTTTTPAPPRYVWGLWSSWSACSATCGLCGSTVRQRSCLLGNCPGPRREARSCGNTVCPEAPPFEIRRLCDRNGKVCRFPLDFNCLQPRTCIQTIPRLRCCAGKIILNECVLEDLKLF